MSIFDKISDKVYDLLHKKEIEELEESFKRIAELSPIEFKAGRIIDVLGDGRKYTDCSGLFIRRSSSLFDKTIEISLNDEEVFYGSYDNPVYKPGEWESLLNELYVYAHRQIELIDAIEIATPQYCQHDQYDVNTMVEYYERKINYTDYDRYKEYTFDSIKVYNVYYCGEKVFNVEKPGDNISILSYKPGEWEEVVKKTAEDRKKTPEQIAQEQEEVKQKQKTLFENRLSELRKLNKK